VAFIAEVFKPGETKKDSKKDELVNNAIRFPKVLLIGPNGEQLGVMSSREAQFKANEFDLDLMCVNPNGNPPVCKILNYGKFKYEQKKKAKLAKKNQKVVELKEAQLSPMIGIHDIETKAKAAREWLNQGNRVKVSVFFKGRQMSHIEVGQEVLDKFIERLSDISIIEKPAVLEGRNLAAILAPKK